jgi:hypothetical protein
MLQPSFSQWVKVTWPGVGPCSKMVKNWTMGWDNAHPVTKCLVLVTARACSPFWQLSAHALSTIHRGQPWQAVNAQAHHWRAGQAWDHSKWTCNFLSLMSTSLGPNYRHRSCFAPHGVLRLLISANIWNTRLSWILLNFCVLLDLSYLPWPLPCLLCFLISPPGFGGHEYPYF